MPREVQTAVTFDNKTAEEYEERHVHAVYEQIAGHFSETRYKVLANDRWFTVIQVQVSHGQ